MFFIVYDIKNNQTTIPHKEHINNPVMISAQQILVGLNNSGALNTGNCTIWPCIQELLANLALPNEGPGPMPIRPPGPMGPGGPPPNMMMHGMARPPHMGQPGPPMRMMMAPGQQRMMMQPGPGPVQGPHGGYMG